MVFTNTQNGIENLMRQHTQTSLFNIELFSVFNRLIPMNQGTRVLDLDMNLDRNKRLLLLRYMCQPQLPNTFIYGRKFKLVHLIWDKPSTFDIGVCLPLYMLDMKCSSPLPGFLLLGIITKSTSHAPTFDGKWNYDR